MKQPSMLLTALLALLPTLTSSQTVNLGYATYKGTFNATAATTDFLGIRFAAAPTGRLRFQAPAPPAFAPGVQLANTQPPACPQGPIGGAPTDALRPPNIPERVRRQAPNPNEIEDCLFLNVHVSGQLNPRAKMPVVFWIHGGGYTAGSTMGESGDDLIREAGGGIVAVEVEYRLGIFGFIAGREVKEKGALNAGLLDQQFAMEWVQRNIHLFGGDPMRVTIWGESAGAGSVLMHLVAHGGNTQPPLFHAAMSSSLYQPPTFNFDDVVPEELFANAVKLSGCSNARDAFACLVAAPAATIEATNNNISAAAFSGVFIQGPVVDGSLIIERPVVTIERGRLNAKNLLAIGNQNEGVIFVNAAVVAQLTLTEYVAALFPTLGAGPISAIVKEYTSIGLPTTLAQATAIYGEAILICPTYTLMNSFEGSVHKGLFAIPPAHHGDDVVYYFPATAGPPFKNAQFDASFSGAFMSFVKNLVPDVHVTPDVITPHWDAFKPGNHEMLFNRTEALQPDIRPITTDPGLVARCSFWKSLAPVIPQ